MRFVYAALAAILVGGTAGWFWPARAQPPAQPMPTEVTPPQPAQPHPPHMPMDTPVQMGSVQAVCTGIGLGARSDPRWASFPIRLEFANRNAQYLSRVHVDLFAGSGQPLASLDCDGAWVLLGVAPGTYRATATLLTEPGGGTASATFAAPASGQKRVVLQFPTGQNQ